MSVKKLYRLKGWMKTSHRNALGDLPTTHQNCIAKCGVARPGKTARDRAKALDL